jgi:hypothetical protein
MAEELDWKLWEHLITLNKFCLLKMLLQNEYVSNTKNLRFSFIFKTIYNNRRKKMISNVYTVVRGILKVYVCAFTLYDVNNQILTDIMTI